jgi:hypothetical protein
LATSLAWSLSCAGCTKGWRSRRGPAGLCKEYVLTGLDQRPDPDSVRNMAGYDQCPPNLRRRIAYNPRPMIFVQTPTGQTILAEFRQLWLAAMSSSIAALAAALNERCAPTKHAPSRPCAFIIPRSSPAS